MRLPASNIQFQNISTTTQKLLVIPFFQRDYSWGVGQVQDLFDDLLEAFKNGEDSYNVGNVQFVTFDRKENLVIDGQQRITTYLTIIETFVNKIVKYPILKEKLEEIFFHFDCRGRKKLSRKLLREDEFGNKTNALVSKEVLDYIELRVEEIIPNLSNWEEQDGFLDFISNSVEFTVQTYYAVDCTTIEQKEELLTLIMKHFLKMNVRGKAFNTIETLEIIQKLQNR